MAEATAAYCQCSCRAVVTMLVVGGTSHMQSLGLQWVIMVIVSLVRLNMVSMLSPYAVVIFQPIFPQERRLNMQK